MSWAGLCPRNDESAGKASLYARAQKRHLAQNRLGDRRLGRGTRKNSYLHAQFLRLKSRRGAKKAILAVAASMLTAAYFMLRDGVEYEDLGADHFDRRDKDQTIRRLLKRLADLGCNVEPHRLMPA